MKRILAGVAILAIVAAVAYGTFVTRQERTYQELIQRGDAALGRGDTFAAIEAFSGAIALRADSMVAYLKRGEAYRRRNELEAALRDLREASEIDRTATRPHELLGDVNLALDRFAEAAEQYDRYVALDDQSSRVLYKLALARYRSGSPLPCVGALQQSLALDDRFPEAQYLLGLCLRDAQRSDAALAALERAVVLAPALLPAREELADLYGRLGRGEARIAQLDVLMALDPGPSREVALGLAYARVGDSDSAVTTLGRAARRYPDHDYTFAALGRVWLEIAEARQDRIALGKALTALRSATRTDGDSQALTLLGRALLQMPDDEAAERTLRRAAEKPPVDPLAFYYLAEASERRGHLRTARQALLDYRTLAGEERDLRSRVAVAARIGDLSVRLNETANAVQWYQRAVNVPAPDVSVLVRLAEAQWRAGQPAAARATIDRVLERDPNNGAAVALNRRIR